MISEGMPHPFLMDISLFELFLLVTYSNPLFSHAFSNGTLVARTHTKAIIGLSIEVEKG